MTDMLCSDAEKLIPLSAGGDVAVDEQSKLDQHLTGCAKCSKERDRMLAAMRALHALRDSVPADISSPGRSSADVWRAVRSRITAPVRGSQAVRNFNGWVAVLAVCSLVLAVVSICQTLPSNSTIVDGPGYWPESMSQPAGFELPQQDSQRLYWANLDQPEPARSER